MTKKLWGYARTSIPKKEIATNELQKQIEGINGLIRQYPQYSLYKLEQEAVSGTKKGKERPKRKQILDNIEKVDGVIVDTLSRWGRDLVDVVETIKWLGEKNKIFISKDLCYFPDDMNSKIMLPIFSALAEVDRIFTVERLKEGRRIYVEKGGKLGRKQIPIPNDVRKQIVKYYDVKKLGLRTIEKLLDPIHYQGEEINMGRMLIRRVLEEENVKIRRKK